MHNLLTWTPPAAHRTIKPIFIGVVFVCTALISTLLGSAATHAAPSDPVTFGDSKLRDCVLNTAQIVHSNPTYITEAEAAAVTSIACANEGVGSIDGLEHFVNLERLYVYDYTTLGNAPISNLSPLAGLIHLEYLNLSSQSVSDITPLAALVNLEELILQNNPINSISALSGLTKLQKLSLSNTTNSQLDISPLANMNDLVELRSINTKIADISPLSGLTKLETLELFGNNITDISPVTGLTNLTYLRFGSNDVTNVSPIAGLTSLEYLDASGNNITNLSPLAGLVNVTFLNLGNNGISNIAPLAELPLLENLRLGSNNISDITPLAGLINLRYLDLYVNSVSNISPVANLVNLEYLILGWNAISDITPMVGLPGLISFGLENNRITLPGLAFGASQSNIIKGLDGSLITPTGSGFEYSSATGSWRFPQAGTFNLAWTQEVTIGGVTATFSGRITQTQLAQGESGGGGVIDEDGSTPGVPNTGVARFITKNPFIVLLVGIAASISLVVIARRRAMK